MTYFLIVNHCSSGETSRHTLLSPGSNCCVRCCDGFGLLLAYKFQFIWMILFIAQLLPLLVLVLTTCFREPTLQGCIDLRHYGMRVKPEGQIIPVAVGSNDNDDGSNFNQPFGTTTTASPQSYVSGSNSTSNSTISYRIVGTFRQTAHICGKDLEYFIERVCFSFVIAN